MTFFETHYEFLMFNRMVQIHHAIFKNKISCCILLRISCCIFAIILRKIINPKSPFFCSESSKKLKCCTVSYVKHSCSTKRILFQNNLFATSCAAFFRFFFNKSYGSRDHFERYAWAQFNIISVSAICNRQLDDVWTDGWCKFNGKRIIFSWDSSIESYAPTLFALSVVAATQQRTWAPHSCYPLALIWFTV